MSLRIQGIFDLDEPEKELDLDKSSYYFSDNSRSAIKNQK
jgi:hypothetical protein